jgi:hypothetical protein
MAKMTPEQEATYALDHGVARSSLSMPAQLAYDRLRQDHQERPPAQRATDSEQKAPEGKPDESPNCSGCGESSRPMPASARRAVSLQTRVRKTRIAVGVGKSSRPMPASARCVVSLQTRD